MIAGAYHQMLSRFKSDGNKKWLTFEILRHITRTNQLGQGLKGAKNEQPST